MPFLVKIILAIISWAIFSYVVIQVPYPDSLTQASAFQLFTFFTPLFVGLTLTIDLLLNFLTRSIIVAFALTILPILLALDALNFISAGLLLAATFILFTYFKKPGLTSSSNIPKLTRWRKRRRSS